jgi:protein disulfide isomerase family A protein 3
MVADGANVDIVKMDATANDVPAGYDVRGFPTLFWVPGDTKKVTPYNGGRELADFVKFIDANKSKVKTEL